MLVIYGRPNSINVRKVLWTVEELGLPYQREDWGRGYRPLTDPAFVAVNEFALIPAIDDDGFILSESNAIIRYLAANHGRDDLLPRDLKGRATVERWMDWQAAELTEAGRAAFHGYVTKVPQPGGDAAIAASVEGWPKHMAMVERQLDRTGAYIAGGEFTLADVCIGLGVNRWFCTPLPIQRPDLPATAAYYERLSGRKPFLAHGRNGLP
jgi:glutathione S-transferase